MSTLTTSVSGCTAAELTPIELHTTRMISLERVSTDLPVYTLGQECEMVSQEVLDELTEKEQLLDDVDLIALITMAEAEGESEYGQRLVIDTILNRIDSSYFPDTASGVIYQSGQFECVWNGRVSSCYVREDICQLVREEIANRTNYDVMYFISGGGFSAYGTPLFQEGNHWFSGL